MVNGGPIGFRAVYRIAGPRQAAPGGVSTSGFQSG
jgi:hypothetical protein